MTKVIRGEPMEKKTGKKKRKTLKWVIIAVIVVIVFISMVTIGPAVFGKLGDSWDLLWGKDKKKDGKNETPVETDLVPTAILTASKYITEVNKVITFDGNTSFDPDRKTNESGSGIVLFIWDFGDGSDIESTTNGTLDHVFTKADEYRVKLTVMDNEDSRDSDNITVKIVPAKLYIAPGSSILLGEPIFGLASNSTHYNWTVEEEAKVMTINVSVSGANFREGQANSVVIELLDPYEDLLKNETVKVIGGKTISWVLLEDEISLPGEYDLRVRVEQGASIITLQATVNYL